MKQSHPEVLFLFLTLDEAESQNYVFNYHLGAGYILAYLQDKGIQAKQFIYKKPIGLDELAERILRQNPRIVGFTCYDANYYLNKLISQTLKKKNPQATIIFGGPTATFSDELIMQDNPAIDICVRGEGEWTVYALVKQLKVDKDLSRIKGITYRLQDKLIRNPQRPLICSNHRSSELDILPSPYLEGILPANGSFGIATSRGCIFRCAYCNFSAMSRWTVRYYSVERVIAELKLIARRLRSKKEEAKNNFVEIWDDAFSLNIERAKEICRKIIAQEIHLTFLVQTRVERVDKELLSLMQQAGFQQIHFGLESAVPRVLRTIKKIREPWMNKNSLTPEKRFIKRIRQNVLLAKKIGLIPTVSVIMGLPGASLRDDKKTINFVKQLKVRHYYHNYLKIYSGTELFNTHTSYGLGIKSPLTLLPYQTEYPYNVFKIPEAKNSLLTVMRAKSTERLVRIFSGDYEELQGIGYPDLLFKNSSIDTNIIEWLRRSMAISPAICLSNSHPEKNFIYRDIEKMVSANLPVTKFHLLEPVNHRITHLMNLSDFVSGRYKLLPIKEIVSPLSKTFVKPIILQFLPFRNYNFSIGTRLNTNRQSTDKIIFTLFHPQDLANFTKLAVAQQRIVLEGDIARFDCCFLDGCRWSETECPALRFRRAIIENNNLLVPCFNGQVIAKVGDSQGAILRKFKLLSSQIKKQRGCNSCIIKDKCSKCLFPYPIDSKEFCQLKRKKYRRTIDINKILKLFKIIRKIRSSDRDLLHRPRINHIVATFDNGLVKVNVDRKRYLYQVISDRLYLGGK